MGDDGLIDILVWKNLLGNFTSLSICWAVCEEVDSGCRPSSTLNDLLVQLSPYE